MYVATQNPVYKQTGGLALSTNNGGSFTNRDEDDGLPSKYVSAFLVDGSKVYAGTYGGLARSDDGGATFSHNYTGFGLSRVGRIVKHGAQILVTVGYEFFVPNLP